ncbi:MAG: hypothetical protein KJ573_15590, partial [Proteobacteria bacterium]|nr:hypothetical protein [Pseudomonadota bacterium]
SWWWDWGTGIDILIDMIKFACYLYLVCHEKPELMLRVRFTTSSCVESSAGKSFGIMQTSKPLVCHGISTLEFSKRLGISQPTASQSVKRGEKIVKEKQLKVMG